MEVVRNVMRFISINFISILTAFINMVDAETSVSGMMVICYDDMEECKNGCPFTCHAVDHCNDSQHPMIACPPDLGLILMVTFAFTLVVTVCCCVACCCLPICCCYNICRNCRRDRTRSNEQPAVSLIPQQS